MDRDNPYALLRALKGAPLAVLIAIRIFPGPATLLQLATATGYDTHTCSKATQALEAMGFVTRAHYRGWQLTTTAQQLPLWTPSELEEDGPLALEAGAPQVDEFCGHGPQGAHAPLPPPDHASVAPAVEALKRENLAFQPARVPAVERDLAEPKREKLAFQSPHPIEAEDPAPEPKREFLASQPSGLTLREPKRENLALQPARAPHSGSGFINTYARVKQQQRPLPEPATPKREKSAFQLTAGAPFQPREEQLLADLIDLTGCAGWRAEQAVRAALAAGHTPACLHLQVLYWHNYLASGKGNGLNNPGFFVAGKLEAGEACPFEDVQPRHKDQARALRWQLDDARRPAKRLDPTQDPRASLPPEPTPEEQELRARWTSAQGMLRGRLPRDTFESWLKDAYPQRVGRDNHRARAALGPPRRNVPAAAGQADPVRPARLLRRRARR